MLDNFIFRALLAGIVVVICAAPLGCFVVWRRMAYFGDTLAHSALFGIALGLLADINIMLSVLVASILLAFVLVKLDRSRMIATDTLLGILAHTSLALGLVLISFTDVQVDLMAYLFGDLLTVSNNDLIWISGVCAVVLATLALFWNRLLAITLHQELAQVEGLPVDRYRFLLMVLIALLVAAAMKVIGILLITSMMIIPPAAARLFSRSPEGMALSATFIAVLCVIAGLSASWFMDTPTGPSIVVCAGVIFLLSNTLKENTSGH